LPDPGVTARAADLAYIDLRHSETRFLTAQQDLNKSSRPIYIIIISSSQLRQSLRLRGVLSLARNAFFHAILSSWLREGGKADVLPWCAPAQGRRNSGADMTAEGGKQSAQSKSRKQCDVKELKRCFHIAPDLAMCQGDLQHPRAQPSCSEALPHQPTV
jgi:hypothetical protein